VNHRVLIRHSDSGALSDLQGHWFEHEVRDDEGIGRCRAGTSRQGDGSDANRRRSKEQRTREGYRTDPAYVALLHWIHLPCRDTRSDRYRDRVQSSRLLTSSSPRSVAHACSSGT